MSKRKPLSKKKRFEIFKRDSFTCQYCGKKPPEAVLQADHIVAVSKGGDDKESNLITACFECNNGKSNIHIDAAKTPIDFSGEVKLVKERRAQLRAYEKLLLAQKEEDEERIDVVLKCLRPATWEGDGYITSDMRRSVRRFLQSMTLLDVQDAMERASDKLENKAAYMKFKYFCGICWGKIKDSSK